MLARVRLAVVSALVVALAVPAAGAACILMLSSGPATGATLHTLVRHPAGVRFLAIDTQTGAMTPGADPNFLVGMIALEELGGRVYGLYDIIDCPEGNWLGFMTWNPATSSTFGPTFGQMNGANLIARTVGGLASDGTLSNERVFPEGVNLERIVFAPDGRLLSIDTDHALGQTSLYEVDLNALTVRLLGTHTNTMPNAAYRDLAFASDGTLWGLQRSASKTFELLRQIDPFTGAIGVTHVLPLESGQYFRGLVSMPDVSTPATLSSWGRVKSVYR